MISSKRVSNAFGGKTARACDNCVKKRARWYCAADDAFLCQACDSSVHSANSLARRHERVRLKTSSSPKPAVDSSDGGALLENSPPPWHRGLTKKARTPRNGKSAIHRHKSSKSKQNSANPFSLLVPEVGGDETSNEENEEQLLYRVPIFDPFVTLACDAETNTGSDGIESKVNIISNNNNNNNNNICSGHEGENLHGFLLPSEMDLEEFAADVESLLGRGLENECFGMEELGLVDCKEKEETTSESCLGSSSGKAVKVEVEEGNKEGSHVMAESEIDMMREPFELNFEDYDSPAASCGDEDEKVEVGMALQMTNGNDDEEDVKIKKRKILLKLDYEAVLTAWAGQRSPWTTGDRPELDADDCWPDFMGISGGEIHHHHHHHHHHHNDAYGEMSGIGGNLAMADGGREARVSRYREKRRTRLFSKKIRYEVRKLNAEKRPRMKGRFVKRPSNFAAGSPAFPSSA